MSVRFCAALSLLVLALALTPCEFLDFVVTAPEAAASDLAGAANTPAGGASEDDCCQGNGCPCLAGSSCASALAGSVALYTEIGRPQRDQVSSTTTPVRVFASRIFHPPRPS